MSSRFAVERAKLCGDGCPTGCEPSVAALREKLMALKKDDWPLLKRTWQAIAIHAAAQALRIARGGK